MCRACGKKGHIAKVCKSAAAAVTYVGQEVRDNQPPASAMSEPDFSRDGHSDQFLFNTVIKRMQG